jgi:hypothetical protein
MEDGTKYHYIRWQARLRHADGLMLHNSNISAHYNEVTQPTMNDFLYDQWYPYTTGVVQNQ